MYAPIETWHSQINKQIYLKKREKGRAAELCRTELVCVYGDPFPGAEEQTGDMKPALGGNLQPLTFHPA